MNLLQDQDNPASADAKPAGNAPETPETTPGADAAVTAPPAGTPPATTETPGAAPIEAATTPGATPPAEAVSETADAGASSLVESAGDVASGMVNIPAEIVFLLGVGLMGMFLYYFGTESALRKRLIGTFIAIAVTAGALFFYDQLGIEKGIELRGGVSARYRIQAEDPSTINRDTQDAVISVLERRLNETGTKELVIVPQGQDQIFIQMPDLTEEEARKKLEEATRAAKLEFRMTWDGGSPQPRDYVPREEARIVKETGKIRPGYEVLPVREAGSAADVKEEDLEHILVRMNPDLEGGVAGANAQYTPQGWMILVKFKGDAVTTFGNLSKENYGRMMAIVMDGEVLSYPRFEAEGGIWGTCQITGRFDEKEAISLAAAMENPLSNELKRESLSQISPTMGDQTVKQGILAGLSGLAITLGFILVYYRFAGILALIGLSLNIVIIFGAMALFKFTLTLPGIAGIILTIGIAIDANVLIYERLREEMAAGKSLKAAIKTAYEKALSAIIDANITTLITAMILYWIATGTVKGFAVTLTIGIAASLFSALLVTRVCFNWATETNFLKKLSFMNLIPKKTINFLGKRRIFMVMSLGLVVASLIITPMKDPRGVDLKGGDMLTIRSAEDLTKQKIEDSLADADIGLAPIVQTHSPLGGGGQYFTIRTAEKQAGLAKAELEKDFGTRFEDSNVEEIGSAVGNEMLWNSSLALGLGILAILIYVTIRFEFAFALGAIVALFHDLIITIGITTLLGREISLITIGAYLTIAGYSINDTIVIFDRVREGLRIKRGSVKDVMNYCLNATLGRTILTSVTTLITVTVLFLFGGPALQNFSLTLIIGVMIGTYSSIFVASPIVLWWAKRTGTNLRREVLDSEQGKVGPETGELVPEG